MKSLNLLVLRCRNIEVARQFYELFGMSFEKHRHGNGPEHYACKDDRGVFELYPAREGETDRTGLGFAVGKLEETRVRLASIGAECGAIVENEWGRSFVARDPDSRQVEVKEMVSEKVFQKEAGI